MLSQSVSTGLQTLHSEKSSNFKKSVYKKEPRNPQIFFSYSIQYAHLMTFFLFFFYSLVMVLAPLKLGLPYVVNRVRTQPLMRMSNNLIFATRSLQPSPVHKG